MSPRTLILTAALLALAAAPAVAEDEPPAPPKPEDAKEAPAKPPRAVMPALHAADADRDGSVTAAEWAAHLETLNGAFKKLDANGDGTVAADEMPAPPRRRRPHMNRPGERPGAGRPGPGHQGPRPPRPPVRRAHAGPGGPPPPRGQRPDRRPEPHMRGPAGAPPRGDAGLEARLDRLIHALERLLEERKAPAAK